MYSAGGTADDSLFEKIFEKIVLLAAAVFKAFFPFMECKADCWQMT